MPPTDNEIRTYLLRQDTRLQTVLANTPHPRRQRTADLYLALLRSILSQQLSGKAASTIYRRFLDLFESGYPEPDVLADLTTDTLRSAGVSQQKAGYLKNVADYARRHDLSAPRIRRMPDAAIIAELTQIKGVGTWTVQMLLMFPLNRPDVLPVHDLTIQQAIRRLYRLRSQGPALRKRMHQVAEPWRPYRTVVCKYLWAWHKS